MAKVNDPSVSLWNEARFNEFYLSGEPETTPNYPLLTYFAEVEVNPKGDGEIALYLRQNASTHPGEMLIVENTDISCACIRDSSLHTETLSLQAPTTVFSPLLHRIPPEAHQHLAHKLAEAIPALEAAGDFDADHLPQYQLVEYLDARQHTPIVIPGLNLHAGMNSGSSRTKRGPWNPVEEGATKILDYESVWNIIANNAMCFKVRSKSREQPSQVETCDFWGMWITPSFMNHSCAPNCHAMRVGNSIIIRAARVIAAGEELTLPYFDIYQPLCKRQWAAERWGFRCSCRRCAYESSIGKPYNDIQEVIVNLEEQMRRSSALQDGAPREVTVRLLEKMAKQVLRITDLVQELGSKECEASSAEQNNFLKVRFDCILASFSGPSIAAYAINLLETYEGPVQRNAAGRFDNAGRFFNLIVCLTSILDVLTSVHQGSLFWQEIMSILIKAHDDVLCKDIDDKEFKILRLSLNLNVTVANEHARSYYGPYVKVFESMNSRMTATEP